MNLPSTRLGLIAVFCLVISGCVSKEGEVHCHDGFVINAAGDDCEPPSDMAIDAPDMQNDTPDDACSCSEGLLCQQETGECVQCLSAEDCDDSSLCVDGQCVECSTHSDCSPSTPVCGDDGTCQPCVSNEQCQMRDSTLHVCSEGACFGCTSNEDCDGNVCDQIEHTCTTLPATAVGECRACVSSSQCESDEACVQSVFEDEAGNNVTEYVCLPRQAEAAPLCARPFVKAQTFPSAEGESAEVCGLALASCAAYRHFRTPQGECTGGSAPTDAMNDSCGAPDVDDAVCQTGGAGNRCTYLCFSNDDCRTGSECKTSESPSYCDF